MVMVVKPEPGSPTKPNGNRVATTSDYDPRIVYILELAAILAIKDEDSTAAVGKDVAEALQNVVRGSANSHPVIVSRAVFYLLHLLNVSHVSPSPELYCSAAQTIQEHSSIRAPVILHTISSLDPTTMEKSALPVLKGLALCMRGPRPLRNEIANTPDFWSTLRSLHLITDAASSVFELLVGIMADTPSAITADNYEFAVMALNDFATAGSAGAMVEQKRDRNVRRSNQVKALNTRSVHTLPFTGTSHSL